MRIEPSPVVLEDGGEYRGVPAGAVVCHIDAVTRFDLYEALVRQLRDPRVHNCQADAHLHAELS